MRIGNAEFFVTDTRGHRQVHDLEKPYQEGVSMLGVTQKAWLKKGMKESTADFLFVVSTVNLMIPHVMSPVEKGNPDIIWYDNKDEAWTAVALERDELIDFWDELDQPVLVLTGDLHNSIAIKVTDNVWEFAAGPHNSNNHSADLSQFGGSGFLVRSACTVGPIRMPRAPCALSRRRRAPTFGFRSSIIATALNTPSCSSPCRGCTSCRNRDTARAE